jgi:hypothetical protein
MNKNVQIRYLDLEDQSCHKLQGKPRQRVLRRGHPMLLHIGSAHFRIVWGIRGDVAMERALEAAKTKLADKNFAQSLDLTVADDPYSSLPPTAYELRSQYTPSVGSQYQNLPKIVHEKLEEKGGGGFGTVHKTVDLSTGELWAVKTCNDFISAKSRPLLKREVEILASLTHVGNAPEVISLADHC